MHNFCAIEGRKIRVALVGCGRISANHFSAIAAHCDDIELVDVCDIDASALALAVSNTGARGHASLSQMLSLTSADVVALTTPSGLHASQAVQVAKSGHHVITEKPMATRWSDGICMIKACDEAKVRLFVVKQNRNNTTLRQLKQAIDEGRFGRIYSVAVNVFWTRPQTYYDSAKWRGTWEFDGGALMNQASHYVDLLHWLIGPVESVSAYTATLARDIEVEDSGAVALRWRCGALGTVNVSMLTYPKNLEGSITVLGEKGTAQIGGIAVNEIKVWEFSDLHSSDTLAVGTSYQTASVYGFGHTAFYDNVVKTFRGQAEPATDGREGLKSLELLIAMYRSARDGRRVALPLDQ